MNEFSLGKDEYPEIPKLIAERVPSFIGSSEYVEIAKENWDKPSIVVSAFVQYLIRLQNSNKTNDAEKIVESCYKVIEELVNIDNYKVKIMVIDEILEVLREEAIPEVTQHLGPESKRFYFKNV